MDHNLKTWMWRKLDFWQFNYAWLYWQVSIKAMVSVMKHVLIKRKGERSSTLVVHTTWIFMVLSSLSPSKKIPKHNFGNNTSQRPFTRSLMDKPIVLFPSVLCNPLALSISKLKQENISKLILICESHLKLRGNRESSVVKIRCQAVPLGVWASPWLYFVYQYRGS